MAKLVGIKLPVLNLLGVRYQVKEVNIQHGHFGDDKSAVSFVVEMDPNDVSRVSKAIVETVETNPFLAFESSPRRPR